MIISMVMRHFRLMGYDMAYFDMESHKVSALENQFGTKVLGVRAITVNHVSGTDLMKMVGRARFELATNGLKVRCSTD